VTLPAFVLNGLLAVPVVFVALVLLVGRRNDAAGVRVAAVGGLVVLGWSIWLAALSGTRLDGTHVDVAWLAAIDVRWHLGVDGISLPLLLMSTVVFACTLLALVRHAPEGGGTARLAALLLVIEAGVLGSFLALDLVLFFAFFEVALIPMWFVIDQWGDGHGPRGEQQRRRAATRFLVFTVLGSALMLVGFVLVRSEAGTFDIVRIAASYDPTGPLALTAAALVALGLAVKTPLWPLHIWLPDAHSKAPTVGSVVLAAVLLKLGTYGFLRFWLPLVDPGWDWLLPVVGGLAVVGIVYGALACLAQTDLKRLIAYSSVGHMGFVVLAAATYTVGGVQGAVYASVAHGVVTGLLFFLAGAVKDRYGTGDLRELRGLYGRVPRLGGLVALGAMASLGLPGLAGFWGEMLAVRAAAFPADALPRGTFVGFAVIAALGVILASAYFLALLRSAFQAGETGASPPPAVVAGDVSRWEWLVWSPLVAATVVLGVAPGLLLTPVAEATAAFLGGGR
jgi:NADH-quinone oxidoreductase subunit M